VTTDETSSDAVTGPAAEASPTADGAGRDAGPDAMDAADASADASMGQGATDAPASDAIAYGGAIDAAQDDSAPAPDASDAATAAPEGSPFAPGPDASGNGPVVLYSNLSTPIGITVYGGDVCWVGGSPSGLYCAPITGGPPASVRRLDTPDDAPFLYDAFDLALDATYVYWSNGSHNQVVRKQLPNGTAGEYFTGPGRVSFLTLDGTGDVYATDFDPSRIGAAGFVVQGPVGGGPTSTVCYGAQPTPSGVATFDGMVFWGNASADVLRSGPYAGNVPPWEVSTPGPVSGVAIDSHGTVYLIANEQQILRLQRAATQTEAVFTAPGPFGMGDIAVDEQWIYWTEPALGTVMRLAK
jgi:hypothetical protein